MTTANAHPREIPPPHHERRHPLAVASPRTLTRVLGIPLAVHDSDPGSHRPAIVCLHAIGHDGDDFTAFASAFRARHRIVAVDWPGHGASGPDTEPASARRYALLLAGLLDAMGLCRPVLFGNSIGGAAALAHAAAHPDAVRGLVVCNPGGLDPGGVIARCFIGYLVSRFARGVAGDPRYAGWYARYYAGILRTPPSHARRAAIVAAAYESAPRLVEAWTSFARPEADLRGLLPTITAPVFVGWAMRDRLVQWRRNRAAVRTLPGATVVGFQHAGHAPFLEEPERFNAAVEGFLARVMAPDADACE